MSRFQSIQSMRFAGVSFAYDNAEPVFSNLTGEPPRARAVWLRSPGWRGKSTLLRLMAGLIMPTTGAYYINGVNVADMSFEEFLPFRLGMGYSFEFGGLLNNKSLAENLVLPLAYHKICADQESTARAEDFVRRFGLAGMKHLRPFAVPGSVRKLACVMRALIHFPEVVFLDEPLAGLKGENVRVLVKVLEMHFAERGLKQIYFTSESPVLAEAFQAEEWVLARDGFAERAEAA